MDLVRYSEVDPEELPFMEKSQSLGQIAGWYIELEVAPVCKTFILRRHFGQSRIMHSGTDGVLDGMAQNGQRCSLKGPMFQVVQAVNNRGLRRR